MLVLAPSSGYVQFCRGTNSAADLIIISSRMLLYMEGKNVLSPPLWTIYCCVVIINIYCVYAKLNAFETFCKHVPTLRLPRDLLGTCSSRWYANMHPLKIYKPDVTKHTKQVHHTHHTLVHHTSMNAHCNLC